MLLLSLWICGRRSAGSSAALRAAVHTSTGWASCLTRCPRGRSLAGTPVRGTAMTSNQLCAAALGIVAPWSVQTVGFDTGQRRLAIHVDFAHTAGLSCDGIQKSKVGCVAISPRSRVASGIAPFRGPTPCAKSRSRRASCSASSAISHTKPAKPEPNRVLQFVAACSLITARNASP